MTIPARLLFLTQHSGETLLNLQFKDGKMPLQISLSRGMLANLVADGARMLGYAAIAGELAQPVETRR